MYEMEQIVKISDCYKDGLHSPVSMLTMLGDCSQLWLRSEPTFDQWLKDTNTTMIISSRQMDVYRRPAMGENVTIRTQIFRFKPALGYRNTLIIDEAGEVVAAAYGVGAFIDKDDFSIKKIPADVLETIDISPKFEMDYAPRKIKTANAELVETTQIRVTKSMLDFNKHVNNAQYVRASADVIPPDYDWNRLRIEYKGQARLGDMMNCEILRAEDGSYIVTLSGEDGTVYTIASFEQI